jgi:hypothetical protein
MKNSAKRARAEAWTTKTKHSRGKTLQGNNKEIFGNIIGGANKVLYHRNDLNLKNRARNAILFI